MQLFCDCQRYVRLSVKMLYIFFFIFQLIIQQPQGAQVLGQFGAGQIVAPQNLPQFVGQLGQIIQTPDVQTIVCQQPQTLNLTGTESTNQVQVVQQNQVQSKFTVSFIFLRKWLFTAGCHQRKFAGDSQQKYINGLLNSNK